MEGEGGGHSRQRKLLEVNEKKKKKRAEHGMCWRYVGD